MILIRVMAIFPHETGRIDNYHHWLLLRCLHSMLKYMVPTVTPTISPYCKLNQTQLVGPLDGSVYDNDSGVAVSGDLMVIGGEVRSEKL